MKTKLFKLATATLIVGALVTGCESKTEQKEKAEENVQEAKEELHNVQKDINKDAAKEANAEEWKSFKTEAELKISENDKHIAELKIKKSKPSKILDPLYQKKIEILEERNRKLRTMIGVYEEKHSDWESFKREYKHDADELGQAIKDIGTDNTK